MDQGKLNLIIRFHVYTDGAPIDTEVEDSLVLSIPRLEAKYVVFPKVVEGMTERIVEVHDRKVSAWELQKAKEEAEKRRRPQLWDVPAEEVAEVDAAAAKVGELMDAMMNVPTEAEPVGTLTADEFVEGAQAHGMSFTVDGQALINATESDIRAAVAEAARVTAGEEA